MKPEEEDDADEYEESHISCSDLIFLPFHPVFRMFVLMSAIVKALLGPMKAVYGVVNCSDVMDKDICFSLIKHFYLYFCDLIYFADTLLHIVHRQVTDQAMKRGHLPKSGFLIFIDVLALIPFFALIAIDTCTPVEIWPNICSFSEFLVIYRVVEYFSMLSTHSTWKLIVGFAVVVSLCVNCVSCFFVMLTWNGLCKACSGDIYYDWRKYVAHKLNETDENFATYIYSTSFVLSLVLNSIYEQTKPSTIMEYFVVCAFIIIVYLLNVYVLTPKIFAESMLKYKRVCEFHPRVVKFTEETKRRHTSPSAHINVTQFYNLIWKKRKGIAHIPDMISDLPRNLRVDIRQDLVWQVFYHSPTLRNTSTPFKRYLSEFINLEYMLPGEKFFSGHHSHTKLYYLKFGIVELLSADDGVTPMLTFTGGTILGDVSFLVTPDNKNINVRCVTYCEVFVLHRFDILRAMQNYPDDKRKIIESANERIKHARTLYTCKQHVRGLDRAEDEGIAWLKRRWWEISEAVTSWKMKTGQVEIKCDLPQEEAVYHCAKYIGQLVLCSDENLQKKSLFTNVKFPLILAAQSSFVRFWHAFMFCNVYIVLITYPPNMTRDNVPGWFKFIQIWTDFIYTLDICMSLLTSTRTDNVPENFITVLFTRCKRLPFILDVLATVWLENIVSIMGRPDLYNVCQLNRLIKIYILFESNFVKKWNIKEKPFFYVIYRILLIILCYIYISAYTVYLLWRHIPHISKHFFYGVVNLSRSVKEDIEIKETVLERFFKVPLAYIFEDTFTEFPPENVLDIYFAIIFSFVGFIVYTVCKGELISFLYLKYRDIISYQSFVTNLKQYYSHIGIHRDLMVRLDRYLLCQWNYYRGMDILNVHEAKQEPFDVYWKVHGEISEDIIGSSKAFIGADQSLIRELAFASKCLIMPKNITLLIFGVRFRTFTWIMHGSIRAEYYNEKGELQYINYQPGEMITETALLPRRISMMTYVTSTDCELLYVKLQDCLNIMKRHPTEWHIFQNAMEEIEPDFEKMFESYVNAHKQFRKKNHTKNKKILPILNDLRSSQREEEWIESIDAIETFDWLQPDSSFMFFWMLFRVITVLISIMSASLQDGSGAVIRPHLMVTGIVCDFIAFVDIVLKMFMYYYDTNGILIYSIRMRVVHYLTRGFLMDIIGTVPWYIIIRSILTKDLLEKDAMFINTVCKFSHLYIVTNFFNYLADKPSRTNLYILILKWQLVSFLMMLGVSHFLMNHCIDFTFNSQGVLLHMGLKNDCWIPSYVIVDEEPTIDQLHLIFAESLNLALCGLTRMVNGIFRIDRHNMGVGILLIILEIVFWFITCYSVILLVLSFRGDTIFQHNVNQLQKFLRSERIDERLIKRSVDHFSYWWLRTRGINIHLVMTERLGIIFRQDINYYLYKKTFAALNKIFQGSEMLERQLASSGFLVYFRSGEQVMREMDLMSNLFVVHRGTIIISKEGKDLAVLRKGSIFGPLNCAHSRPVQVTARSDSYADLFQISTTQFQDVITDEIRLRISENSQFKHDYLCPQRRVHESPYNDIEYILRGRKAIHLPLMKFPIEARKNNWYHRWLFLAWLIGPCLSVAVVLLFVLLPDNIIFNVLWFLFALDVVHLGHFLSEFCSIEVVIVNDVLVRRRVGVRRLLQMSFYIDFISMILPLMSVFNWSWVYQLARILRLYWLIEFNNYICTSFKSQWALGVMKFIFVALTWHALVCGWIYFACQEIDLPKPLTEIGPKYNATVDYNEWMNPALRKKGCPRMTLDINDNDTDSGRIFFLVPRNWKNDYTVALAHIIFLHTHSYISIMAALNANQIYYMLSSNFILILLDIWIMSVAINAVYTKYRELYLYDYRVENLITYLHQNGLSPLLIDDVKEYTSQLWQRQRGNWLPELALQAPTCLREDLLGALYMHHVSEPLIFKGLPEYFTRQLVARFQRIVLFPEKCIIQEGDIYQCIFFIHEGEVEKWYSDPSGEKKLVSVLTVNNYFGIIPALFGIPFVFSYHTKTVVDLVFLKFTSWKDLLDAYPEIKQEIFSNATKVKAEMGKSQNHMN